MTERHLARTALLVPLVVSGLALTGCMSSPTYGTDKTAGEQLTQDLSNAFSFAPQKKASIEYKPRPALVKPAPGQRETLPVPQDSITQTASAEWPESPEQRRARLRADATAHQDDPRYQSQIINDIDVDPAAARQTARDHSSYDHPLSMRNNNRAGDAARRAEVNRRLAESKQGDPTSRKYLSEPPLDYRVASGTAPQGDIGEDEFKKERRLKREATGKKGMFDWLPW